MIRHRLCVYLSATLMVFGAANAAVGASLDPTFDPARDEALREQQRQIQLEQQRLEQERLAREGTRQAPPPTDLSSPQSADETKGSDSGPCQNITQIDLVGTTLINENERLRLVSPFLDRCLNATDINALLQAVGQWYADQSAERALTGEDQETGETVIGINAEQVDMNDGADVVAALVHEDAHNEGAEEGTADSAGNAARGEWEYQNRVTGMETGDGPESAEWVINELLSDVFAEGADQVSGLTDVQEDLTLIGRSVVFNAKHGANVITRDNVADYTAEQQEKLGGPPIQFADESWGYVLESLNINGELTPVVNGRARIGDIDGVPV